MPALEEFTHAALQEIINKGRYRQPQAVRRLEGAYVEVDGKRYLSFACNDYLGLSHHPHVKEAAIRAVQDYGSGAGASRMVTGNHPLYSELEAKLATLKGTESACVLGSGYLANSGVIAALMAEGDLILADKLSHACLLDGAKLSGATLRRFPHNSLSMCEKLLARERHHYRHCLLVTETIFSMDGDKAPIEALARLAKQYDSWLLTDDAHGLGVAESHKADIQMGTLSKAAGSYGGYVCGSSGLIDYLKNSTRSLIFSTALPPMVVASAIAALDVITEDAALTRKPLAHARLFTSLLGLQPAESPIVPVIVGAEETALAAANRLRQQGFWVAAIRPPTVPPHSSRLRFAFTSNHTEEDIIRLAAAIQQEGSIVIPGI